MCEAVLLTESTSTPSPSVQQAPVVEVTAYPNPYTDKIVFTIRSHVSGNSSFELVGLLGEKVSTLYQGHIEKDAVKTLIFNAPSTSRKTLIYHLRVGNEIVTGKVIYTN